ncbi:MAG: low molecular weight protein-tyrosine-phosphatase [Anaerolineales bacterium]|nr:low molecular weight protein-tyrosine-phosphatase [Anaerolineales bacterium]
MSEPMDILFVCLGNIVRSPLAENLFRHVAEERGLDDQYVVDSAGTSAYHVGEPPDRRMRQTAKKYGLEYTGRSRQVSDADLRNFDLIVAMDDSNARNLKEMARDEEQAAKIRLMREFDPQAEGSPDVPDPYYGGMEGFENTYQLVKRSVEGLLDALERGEV